MVDDDHRPRTVPPGRRSRAPRVLGAACAVAGLTVLTACSGEVHDAPVLKLADSYSTTHMFARYGVEGFIEDVTAAGDGEGRGVPLGQRRRGLREGRGGGLGAGCGSGGEPGACGVPGS